MLTLANHVRLHKHPCADGNKNFSRLLCEGFRGQKQARV